MRGVWRAGEAQAHSGDWLGWSAVFGADEWPELFHHVLRCLCHVQGFGVGRGPALGNSQCSYRLYRHPTGGRALNPIPFDPRQPCPYRVRPRLLAPCPLDRCDRHGTFSRVSRRREWWPSSTVRDWATCWWLVFVELTGKRRARGWSGCVR